MPVTISGSNGITTPNSVTETTPSTTTASYYYWNNGSVNVAAIGGYSDSSTAGHLELYTTTGSTLTEALRIESNGNATFKVSDAGIVFNKSGALTNSTLNDYEVGTWTPGITPSGGSLTSYSSVGNYVKIGRTVFISAYFKINTVGTASGGCALSGLPFTTLNIASSRAAIIFVREDAVTGQTYQLFIDPNGTTGSFQTLSGGSISWTNNYTYVFSGSYQSAS